MEKTIKDMILRRGCDIERGKLPQTLCANVSNMDKSDGVCSVDKEMQDSSDKTGQVSSLEQQSAQTSEDSFASSTLSFKPRAAKQEMRNCMSLERSLQDYIVLTVAKALLALTEIHAENGKPCRSDEHSVDEDVVTSLGKPVSEWNRGG